MLISKSLWVASRPFGLTDSSSVSQKRMSGELMRIYGHISPPLMQTGINFYGRLSYWGVLG